MRKRNFIAALIAAAAVWPQAAPAQTYPSRAIVMVVPFAAGGTFDVMGRIIAVRMSELLGQQIVVENTTGAGGIIGVTRVMNAAPDGYTILLGSTGTHAYNQTIYKKRRYDAVNDFTPVTLFSEQPMVLEARKDLPANTIPEFAALLKANGAKMQFGSAGAGSTTHLACSLLNSTIGVNVTHVPYRGSAPAANDLIGGQIDYLCGNLGAAAPLITGKQVKAHRGAVARPLAADAGPRQRPRAGADRPRCHHLDRHLPAQGRAEGDRGQAQRGHARDDGDPGDQKPDAGDRRDRRRARPAVAGISRQVRRRRGRALGGPDQFGRATGGLIGGLTGRLTPP